MVFFVGVSSSSQNLVIILYTEIRFELHLLLLSTKLNRQINI